MSNTTNSTSDLTIEEYRSYKIYSDVKLVKHLTKQIGYKNGKGYSSALISSVIDGNRTNEKVWNLYKEVVQNRLNFLYLKEIQKENNLNKNILISKKRWAEIVAHFKAA